MALCIQKQNKNLTFIIKGAIIFIEIEKRGERIAQFYYGYWFAREW